jgi:hypothetical protein
MNSMNSEKEKIGEAMAEVHRWMSLMRSSVEKLEDPAAFALVEKMELGLFAPMLKLRERLNIPFDVGRPEPKQGHLTNDIICPNCGKTYHPAGADREMFQNHPLGGCKIYKCVRCGWLFVVVHYEKVVAPMRKDVNREMPL